MFIYPTVHALIKIKLTIFPPAITQQKHRGHDALSPVSWEREQDVAHNAAVAALQPMFKLTSSGAERDMPKSASEKSIDPVFLHHFLR